MICGVAPRRSMAAMPSSIWRMSKAGPRAAPMAPDQSLALRPLEFGPERVVLDRVDARVVELVEVDVVGAQAPERVLEGLAHVRGDQSCGRSCWFGRSGWL